MSKRFGLTFGSLVLFLGIITPLIMVRTIPENLLFLPALSLVTLTFLGVTTLLATYYKISSYFYQNPRPNLIIVLALVVGQNCLSFLSSFLIPESIPYHFTLFFALLFFFSGLVGAFVFVCDLITALFIQTRRVSKSKRPPS
ncbi:MAG: hypothetical protein MUP45_00395 [Candidatus Marinimicrobia bacterium]|nr:hypothetical protein [Candidatus Neomarinimicrobiota bacterium]